jgi:hypothetical protein
LDNAVIYPMTAFFMGDGGKRMKRLAPDDAPQPFQRAPCRSAAMMRLVCKFDPEVATVVQFLLTNDTAAPSPTRVGAFGTEVAFARCFLRESAGPFTSSTERP